MFDRLTLSSFTMFVCTVLLGCLASKPIVLKPIDPVEPATVVQPVQADAPKTIPTITMHSGESCPPCQRWIANDMPNWQKLGWQVEIIKETTSDRLWPWYEILDGDGLRFQVVGPLTKDKYERERKKALGR
jgi:hypothetical protein